VIAEGTKTATVVNGVSKADTAAGIATAGDHASDGEAPGVVKWADRWIAPNIIPFVPRLR